MRTMKTTDNDDDDDDHTDQPINKSHVFHAWMCTCTVLVCSVCPECFVLFALLVHHTREIVFGAGLCNTNTNDRHPAYVALKHRRCIGWMNGIVDDSYISRRRCSGIVKCQCPGVLLNTICRFCTCLAVFLQRRLDPGTKCLCNWREYINHNLAIYHRHWEHTAYTDYHIGHLGFMWCCCCRSQGGWAQ